MYYFPRRDPDSRERGYTFHVALGISSGITVWISQKAVNIAYRDYSIDDQKPLWTAIYLLSENPTLQSLYHPHFGWDFVKLIGLMRSEVEEMLTLNLRDPDIRKEAGLDTVSIPSRDRSLQHKRPKGQALELIADYVTANPGCTRSDIARGLDRAKSPHLIVQIELLVQAEVIVREHVIRATGAVEYRYRIAGDNGN